MNDSRPRDIENSPRNAGFSLLEVLLVATILLVLGVVAIPNMKSVVATARLRSGLTNMSGVLQNSRMMAVKKNATQTAHFSAVTTGIIGYIKDATDSSPLKATDPQVEWEAPITRYTSPTGAGAPAAITTGASGQLGFTPQTGDPSFNSRGLPCAYSSGTCPNTGFIYYFKDTRVAAGSGWAAVSISPAGRVKKWYWSGSAWTE